VPIYFELDFKHFVIEQKNSVTDYGQITVELLLYESY